MGIIILLSNVSFVGNCFCLKSVLLNEKWDLMREIEKTPGVAWIRIVLHNDTEIAQYGGKEVLVLAGDSIMICTSLPGSELETLARCTWLCSGGVEEWDPSEIDRIFSCRPSVQDDSHCFAIVWD